MESILPFTTFCRRIEPRMTRLETGNQEMSSKTRYTRGYCVKGFQNKPGKNKLPWNLFSPIDGLDPGRRFLENIHDTIGLPLSLLACMSKTSCPCQSNIFPLAVALGDVCFSPLSPLELVQVLTFPAGYCQTHSLFNGLTGWPVFMSKYLWLMTTIPQTNPSMSWPAMPKVKYPKLRTS